MYESEFGTDWERLDRNEILKRSYALGIAATLGEHCEGELDRLKDAAETSYEGSLVDLAYSEGKNRARKLASEHDDTGDVWERLVTESDEITRLDVPDRDGGPPDAVSQRGPDSRPDDGLDRFRLPAFLRRD